MRRLARRVASCSTILLMLAGPGWSQPPVPRAAVAVDPIPAILDAFQSHRIVALCDAHGNEQSQAFLKALVRHPRFADTVNDIVVEFGNARYQDRVDRFVRGEAVDAASLAEVWQNTTVANEIPVDAAFFETVRDVNLGRPAARRVRVLLGDPPIDWSSVRTREDHFQWLAQRDSYPAALIQLEVLARQRRALVVYGQLHFQRKNVFSNLDMGDWRMQTIVSLIESSGPARVFAVWRFGDAVARVQSDAGGWRAPSLAVIRGTTLGAADVTAYLSTPARFRFSGDARETIPKDRWLPLKAEEQFDAVLYLGPDKAMTEMPLSSRICADRAYIQERLRRIALTGIPAFEAERVKKLCGI